MLGVSKIVSDSNYKLITKPSTIIHNYLKQTINRPMLGTRYC